jgi:hypothetical protein
VQTAGGAEYAEAGVAKPPRGHAHDAAAAAPADAEYYDSAHPEPNGTNGRDGEYNLDYHDAYYTQDDAYHGAGQTYAAHRQHDSTQYVAAQYGGHGFDPYATTGRGGGATGFQTSFDPFTTTGRAGGATGFQTTPFFGAHGSTRQQRSNVPPMPGVGVGNQLSEQGRTRQQRSYAPPMPGVDGGNYRSEQGRTRKQSAYAPPVPGVGAGNQRREQGHMRQQHSYAPPAPGDGTPPAVVPDTEAMTVADDTSRMPAAYDPGRTVVAGSDLTIGMTIIGTAQR